MNESLGGMMSGGFATAAIWTIAALVLLVILLIVIRIIRNRGAGTFVLGGRHRVPRLTVIDAAAVDERRRLVLVRRDEIEHLILIGGPTDIVVEQNIRPYTAAAAAQQQRREPQQARPAPSLSPTSPVPPRPTEAQRSQPSPVRNLAPRPESPSPRSEPAAAPQQQQRREAPIAPPPLPVEQRPRPTEAPAARPDQLQTPPTGPTGGLREDGPPALTRENEIDTAFLEEIRPASDAPRQQAPTTEPVPQRQETSIEEEMSRLLDDLVEDERNQR